MTKAVILQLELGHFWMVAYYTKREIKILVLLHVIYNYIHMKQYTFSINMVEQGNKLLDGEIRCNYFEDKTVAYVSNEIIIMFSSFIP